MFRPDGYRTRPENMPRFQWMGYAVIKREILFLSGFTNKGNWIGLNFKITIENYKSTIFPEGEVVLPGPGVSPRLVFYFLITRIDIHLGRVFTTNSGLVMLHSKSGHQWWRSCKNYEIKENSHNETINDVINGWHFTN